MDKWVYINGQWLVGEEATIPALDLSVLRGYGVNEYLRTYGRNFFKTEEHIIRFQKSADDLGLKIPLSCKKIAAIIEEAKKFVPSDEISVKLILTGGVSPDQFLPVDNAIFFVVAYPFIPLLDLCFTKGVKLITHCYARACSTAKSIYYLPSIAAIIKRAHKEKAVDLLFHNASGELLESSIANFFAVKNSTIITPSSGVLKGITRKVVLELARKHFLVEERRVHISEIPSFDGAFLTSSSKGILPVSQINTHRISIASEIRTLMREFALATSQAAENCPVVEIRK